METVELDELTHRALKRISNLSTKGREADELPSGDFADDAHPPYIKYKTNNLQLHDRKGL